MIRLFLLSVAVLILSSRVDAVASDSKQQHKQVVFQGYVGQKNAFTNLLYDEAARKGLGDSLVQQMKAGGANAAIYVVETIDFQSALVFVFRSLSNSSELSMMLEVLSEKPAQTARKCELADKMVMDVVDRYTRCYSNSALYSKETFVPRPISLADVGQHLKDSSEYLIAMTGFSAEVAVSAFKMMVPLQILREHVRLIKDINGRHHFPQLLLESKGYEVDLRETYLWKDTAKAASVEVQKTVAAAEYLAKRKLIFVDSNFLCGRPTPGLMNPAWLKNCATTRMTPDSIAQLIEALEKSGARWDSARSKWY